MGPTPYDAETCRRAVNNIQERAHHYRKDSKWASTPASCVHRKVPTFSAQDSESRCLDI